VKDAESGKTCWLVGIRVGESAGGEQEDQRRLLKDPVNEVRQFVFVLLSR